MTPYNSPPGQYPQQAQMAGPGQMPFRASPTATVLGVPLEPGERVLYFDEPDLRAQKRKLLILGLALLIFAVGIILLVMYAFAGQLYSRAQIVTDRRVIRVMGSGKVTSIPFANIADVDATRQRAKGGGAGALVAGAINAMDSHKAQKLDRRDPAFWAYGVNLIIKVRQGKKVTVVNCNVVRLGTFIASILYDPPSVQRLPDVAFPA